MSGPALSERDLAVLRGFARRIDPSDAGAHNNLGVLYYQKGLVPESIGAFSRALELDPKMQVAQANLELAYNQTGYYDRRVAELREQLRRQPDDREARWELGRTYASLGFHDQAIQEFEVLLARYPDDVSCLSQLGLAEKARGDMDAAAEWFQRALELEPESSVALFYYGEVLYNRGLNEQALAALQGAVLRNPDNADAHYLLAFVYGDMGQHEAARAATKKAISLNPTLARAQTNLSLESPAIIARRTRDSIREIRRPSVAEGSVLAHFNLGLAFRQKGYYVEALREYRLALDNGEDRRLTLQAMAEVHLLRRDIPGAVELYENLVVEFPDSPKLWNERGVCLHQAGRRDEAGESYGQAITLDERYALAWNNLGVLRSHGPDVETATEAFHQALRCRPDLAAARLNLALLLFQRRRFQLALEAYRQVLADQPGNAVAWNGVGLILTELKRYDDAKNAFSRAVESDPNLASAHYNLSFTMSHLGDFDAALRETKRALELEPYYVPQKLALTIDLQYEDPTISIAPEISADITAEEVGADFSFDQRLLDHIFTELQPGAKPEPFTAPAGEDSFALVRDYIGKGLLERASAELGRALQRGADRARADLMHAEIFARRGLHGEALERFRQARAAGAPDADARLGEMRALLALNRAAEAAEIAKALHQSRPDLVEALVTGAQARLAAGNPLEALEFLKLAQERAPGRSDLAHLQAKIAARLGDVPAAVEAYLVALQLDSSMPQVWYELGRLEEKREGWVAARAAYERVLDLLPTFTEAARALADLLRRRESPAAAVELLVGQLSTDPYDLDALLLLGRCLLEDGRADRAWEAFVRVLKFEPESTSALYHYGVARAELRDFPEAIRAWERVVQVDPSGEYAQPARSRARSARDLEHIFAGR